MDTQHGYITDVQFHTVASPPPFPLLPSPLLLSPPLPSSPLPSPHVADLRNVLNNMEPLVDRMSTAGPSEVDVMMSNAKHILREILKGLEALHNMGLVHRDIKGVCVGGGGIFVHVYECKRKVLVT